MPADQSKTIEALLQENRAFRPPKAFAARAHVKNASIYRRADRNFEKFWADFARELVWTRP